MTMHDLTAPLGQNPNRHRRAIGLPVAKIIAVALGLFLGAFVLWAAIANDPSGGEPIAVAPADLRMAKKAPAVIAVPPTSAPVEAAQPAATATPAPPPKAPAGVIVTIIDGKTGAKREVTVAAPPPSAAERAISDQTSADTTGQLPSQLQNQLPSQPRKKH